jgi:proline iminopeptidase
MSEGRKAYPVAELARAYQYLSVSPLHEIFIQEYGNADGLPVIVCHGGPGGGCPPEYAKFFNPELYRIILVDQRGSGKSLPPGELSENNTKELIADMEKIRNALGIERWVIFGGSWGTTLGLLYAQAHPKRVLAMVLRGIFLARQQDIDSFIGEDTEAAAKCPQDWREFKTGVDDLLTLLKISPGENYVDTVLTLLDYPDSKIRNQSATMLCKWEYQISFRKPAPMPKDFTLGGYAMAVIELTYMQKKCFIAENQILDNLAKLPKVPIYIVHGSKDWVCPIIQAELLRDKLTALNYELSYHATAAGHAGSEPENTHCLVEATDVIARQFTPAECY